MSYLATQSLIDSLPIPRRLGFFHVISPAYDPNFRPVNGYLKACYNGLDIQLSVQGVDIICHVCSNDTNCFEVTAELAEPATKRWAEICQHMLCKVLITFHQTTLEYKQHLVDTGRYYVQ